MTTFLHGEQGVIVLTAGLVVVLAAVITLVVTSRRDRRERPKKFSA